MASNSIKNAINELAKYFALFTLQDLVAAAISDDPNTLRQQQASKNAAIGVNEQAAIPRLADLIVDAQTGVALATDITDTYISIIENDDAGGDVLSKLTIYYDDRILSPDFLPKTVLGNLGQDINNNTRSPSKENPSIACFLVNTIRISPSNRNSNALALFMNSVPTIEWSRSVPYIDVQFQSFREAVDQSGRPNTISLIKFLNGATKINEGSADFAMQTATPFGMQDNLSIDSLSSIKNGGVSGFTGMEIFTSPQTLVNADLDQSEGVRAAPVIDKFRPFLSITNLEIDVVATTGIMSYKTAKLELVLHDRSRLHEIADFIKPDMFGEQNSELLIEYGWSHPDKDSGLNPYGPFINSLRKKEKYHIRNSSFAIKDNGEVTITLDLYMKGALDFYNKTITDGGDVAKAQEAVANLQQRIKDIRQHVFKQEQTHIKEIRGIQILNAAGDETSQLELSKDLKRELKATLKKLSNVPSEDASTLRKLLEELYGKDGNDGLARTLLTKLSNQLQQRMDLIQRGKKRTPDPFFYGSGVLSDIFVTGNPEQDQFIKQQFSGRTDTNFVSFAKLALIFIAQPLASSNKFDEVQLLFYPFNSAAGFARVLNIGQFSIEINRFREKFNKIKTLRRSNNLTIRDFVQFMGTAFFDDPASADYGMRDLYTYEDNKETGTNVKVKKKEFRDNPAALSHEVSRRMELAGVPNGTFKMPHLDVYIECVPADNTDKPGNSQFINDQRTILRIHFFDRQASTYETLGDLLKAVRDDDIGNITRVNFGSGQQTNDHESEAQKILNQAKELGLVEFESNDNTPTSIKIAGGVRKLKEFVANSMPSVIYGSSTTSIISAGFQTMNEPRLSTVNMLRTSDASPLTPTGVAQGGIPLWMHPGQMDMKIIGCPIVEFTQGLFVDFETNTSIDNIYHVTKIQHSIKNGEFGTSLSLTPADAYGQYRNLRDRVASAINILKKLESDPDNTDIGTSNSTPPST